MTIRTTLGAFGVLVLAGSVTGLVAQTTPQTQTQTTNEMQLLQRTAQSPNDIAAFLDLARLYVEQRRFDEASRILQRALAAVQHEALVNAGAQQSQATASNEPIYRAGRDIVEPKRIKYVDPVYPPVAQAARVQGYVIVETVIGTDGTVRDARVIKSIPLLDEAALDAVKQWKYSPPMLAGVPVQVAMSVTVIFSLK